MREEREKLRKETKQHKNIKLKLKRKEANLGGAKNSMSMKLKRKVANRGGEKNIMSEHEPNRKHKEAGKGDISVLV